MEELHALNYFGRPGLPASLRKKHPTMYDLPSEYPDDPGLPDQLHMWQGLLLTHTFRPPNVDPKRMMVAVDLNLYYDLNNPYHYKRPDWYAAIGVPRFYGGWDLRLSYVVWDEGVPPFVVVEMLFPGTEEEELGTTREKPNEMHTKWDVYETLKIPYYAVFSHYTDTFRVFKLKHGKYRELPLYRGRANLEEIGLDLGLWYGEYQNHERLWIRWYEPRYNLILTPDERAEKAEKEKQRAEKKRIQAEKKRIQAEKKRIQAEKEKQRAERERDTALNDLEAERERTKQLLARLKAAGIETDI